MRLASHLAIALAVAAAAPAAAHAKSERTAAYKLERAWPTCLRFLRIDEGDTITDKDVDGGYILFEIKDDGRVYKGSLELVRTTDSSGRDAIRMIATIADRPDYMEAGLLDRLAQKLYDDLGEPPEAPAEPAPEPAKPAPKPAKPRS